MNTANPLRPSCLISLLVVVLSIVLWSDSASAQLNFDTALTPPKGGTIIRSQYTYAEASVDRPVTPDDLSLNTVRLTVVHGITPDLALLGSTTYGSLRTLSTDSSNNRAADTQDGFGDITLTLRQTVLKNDTPGATTRLSLFGGLDVPSDDEPFSSSSYNPLVGVVYSYQRQNLFFAANLAYQFNTAGGPDADDRLRADLALLPRLLNGSSPLTGPWGLYPVAEINASYFTDGSFQILGSPGIEFVTTRFVIEAAIQLPILSDLTDNRAELDFAVVIGLRVQF